MDRTMTLSPLVSLRTTRRFTVLGVATLREAAISVLLQQNITRKAQHTLFIANAWMVGVIRNVSDQASDGLYIPDKPKRSTEIISFDECSCPYMSNQLLSSHSPNQQSQLPQSETHYDERWVKSMMKKNGVEVTIHGIANAEGYAIDLFWDLIARCSAHVPFFTKLNSELGAPFITGPASAIPTAGTPIQNYNHAGTSHSTMVFDGKVVKTIQHHLSHSASSSSQHLPLPRAFYDEMVEIAGQEARHFLAWKTRLDQLGVPFGTLPCYQGLWQSAADTKGLLL